MKRLRGCFARCSSRLSRIRPAPVLALAALLVAALTAVAPPAEARPKGVGRAAIEKAIPDYPLPERLTCDGADAVISVLDDMTWESMRVLKRQIAAAIGANSCNIQLVLDSPGGLMIPTLNVAWYLEDLPRQITVTTVVPEGASCNSACTMLYAVGKKRAAGTNATFLFHPLEVAVTNPRLEGRIPAIEDEMITYWIELVRRADPWLARVLAGARVFGRSTRFAYLEAGDLHQNAHGWVSEMRPGCMMVPAEARGDGPAATAC